MKDILSDWFRRNIYNWVRNPALGVAGGRSMGRAGSNKNYYCIGSNLRLQAQRLGLVTARVEAVINGDVAVGLGDEDWKLREGSYRAGDAI